MEVQSIYPRKGPLSLSQTNFELSHEREREREVGRNSTMMLPGHRQLIFRENRNVEMTVTQLTHGCYSRDLTFCLCTHTCRDYHQFKARINSDNFSHDK
jgi:hypothetical protein